MNREEDPLAEVIREEIKRLTPALTSRPGLPVYGATEHDLARAVRHYLGSTRMIALTYQHGPECSGCQEQGGRALEELRKLGRTMAMMVQCVAQPRDGYDRVVRGNPPCSATAAHIDEVVDA